MTLVELTKQKVSIETKEFQNYLQKIEWDYTNIFFCSKIERRWKFKKLFAADETANKKIWDDTVILFHQKRQEPSLPAIDIKEIARQKKQKEKEERNLREDERDLRIKNKRKKGETYPHYFHCEVDIPISKTLWITPEEEMELTRDTWR